MALLGRFRPCRIALDISMVTLFVWFCFIYLFKKKFSFTSIHCSSHLAVTAGVPITRWSLNRRRTIAAGAAVNPPGG